MIAYFALLSFVPLTFISLAFLGLTGRADESSFLVKEIKRALPGAPISRIVDHRFAARRLRVPHLLLHVLDERGSNGARDTPGRRARGGSARGDLPSAALLSALRESQPDVASVRRAGDPARLALRDGERDRVRRRAQLVARAPRRAGARGGATRPRVTSSSPLARDGSCATSIRCRARRPFSPRRRERRPGRIRSLLYRSGRSRSCRRASPFRESRHRSARERR